MIAFADACGRQWIGGGVGELSASAFVGRVGGLAVALGVGMVIGGVGTAWASPADSSDSTASAEGAESATESASTPSKSRRSPARGGAPRSKEAAEVPAPLPLPAATTPRRSDREVIESPQGPATPQGKNSGLNDDARVGVPAPSASNLQRASGERVELPRDTGADTLPESAPAVERPASVGALIYSGDLRSPAAASVPTVVSVPLVVASPVAAQPVMLAAPPKPAASGRVESVWAPLLGNGPASPVQSPVSWVMLAAARRELDAPKAATAPAATVSTGQLAAPAATTVPVPAPAATNRPPVISDVVLSTPNATTGAVTGTVKASDPDGNPLTYKATTGAWIFAALGKPAGTVSMSTNGVLTYTPTAAARHLAAKDGFGPMFDSVSVTVTDSKRASAGFGLEVPISPKNSVPTATKTVGTPNATTGVVTGKVTATDADKDPLAYSVPATTAKGTVAITSAGAFTYTPTAVARHAAARIGAATADKADTFTVTVTDGYGGKLAVPVSVTISPRNTAPTATVSIAKPDPVTGIAKGKVTASDADKDTLTYTATKPANGTVAVTTDGSFAYTPTATARASARTSTIAKTDTFTITVADGHGGSTALKVTTTIAPANTAPVAGKPTVGTPNASTGVVTGTVTATDADKDAVSFSAPASTAKGAVAINANTGAFTYTPTATARHNAARTGAPATDQADTFTVRVTDKYGASAAIPVSVTVGPANAAPVPGTPTVGRPDPSSGVVTGTVTATDADKDALNFSTPATTTKGSVAINASTGAFTYTPSLSARQTATAATTDGFSVTVTDGYGGSKAVNVVVPVDRGIPQPGVITMSTPDPITGGVYGGMGWFIPAQLRGTFSGSSTSTGGGTVVINASTSEFTYTPTRAQRLKATGSTTDTFTITASNGVNTAAQTITVPVLKVVNSAPVAGTPTASTSATTGVVTGAINATDPDKDTLTYTATTATTSKGSAAITSTGAYTYTPTATARHSAARTGATAANKTDTFTATVTDRYGATTAIPVSVTVAPANATPVAGTSTVGTPNATTGVVTGTVAVTDADKDALTYSASASTAKGAVAINATTGAFTYTPTAIARHAAARVGAVTADKTDTFTVTATDGYGGSVAIPVSVTVAPANAIPVAGTSTVGTPNATTGVVTGTVTVTDADKDALTYSASASTTKGAVSINATTGAFTYTPTATARHNAARADALAVDKTDTFTINATDGHGDSVGVQVTVPISPKGATVAFPSAYQSVVEGDSGTKLVTVPMDLSGPVSNTVTANYEYSGGGVSGTGSVVFSPGQTQANAQIPVNGDTTYESNETVTVRLTSVEGAVLLMDETDGLRHPFMWLTIVNDDFPSSSS
jgi:VCBS repeat-containing protein